jgi:hypothetical protein
MCKRTEVDLASGKRVALMPDKNSVAEALTQQLLARGVDVLRMEPAWNAETLVAHLKIWMGDGPITGIYWLPALDVEDSFGEMDLAAWHEALRIRVKSLYAAMRILYDQIDAPGKFLVSATRLGGQHGYDDAGAVGPLGGAVVGFAKTYKRERTGALVKAVDFSVESRAPEIAELLIEETLRDPGAVEVGYKMGLRWTIGLQEQPGDDGRPGIVLDSDSVFLITGAAGSIVSAITADLAAAPSTCSFWCQNLNPIIPTSNVS